MKSLFTFLIITTFLTGCLLEEKTKKTNGNIYGVWVPSANDDITQYLKITKESASVWIYIENLSCISQIETFDNIEVSDKQLIVEFQGRSNTLTLLSNDKLQATSTSSEEALDYSRYLDELPESCGNDSTKQVKINITFEYLPELLENHTSILETDEYFYDTSVTFDMDNSSDISVGDIIFSLDTGFPDIAKTLSWQSLNAFASYVYEVTLDGYNSYYISELTALVQDQSIILTGKSTDFSLIDNISNGIQITVNSIYRLNNYIQYDYFPEDYQTFTSGLDTSLLEDVAGDSNISWDSTSASANLNLTSIVDIRTIEISIID